MRLVTALACVFFAAAGAVAGGPARAADPVVVTPVLDTRATSTGQPLALPKQDPHLIVSRYVVQPGASLPVHKHPFQRYGYVLSGGLRVTVNGPGPGAGQSFDYKPGDFVVEVQNEWHFGTATGSEPLVLLVIDQVEGDHPATELMHAQ